MASIIAGAMRAITEFDEISSERVGDEIKYVFLTTGVLPRLTELKTVIWSFVSPPIRRLKVEGIKEIERGILTKRYEVTVTGKARPRERFIPRRPIFGREPEETLGQKEYRILPLKSWSH